VHLFGAATVRTPEQRVFGAVTGGSRTAGGALSGFGRGTEAANPDNETLPSVDPLSSGAPMKKVILSLATVVAAAAIPSAAYAQLAFNAGAVTDYRYRGISQTRLKPAVQGGVDFAAGGLYVGVWASSIKWIKDAGGDAPAEIDVYGGYKGEIAKDSLTYDVGVLSYQYPGHKLSVSPVTPPRSTAR
jgi:hypothetical protein